MVGTQSPKSREVFVEATKPSKFPVTAFVTAPAPAAGAEQRRVDPEPVQVPEAAVEAEEAEEALAAWATDVDAATEEEVVA